jgi:hypothetical protein
LWLTTARPHRCLCWRNSTLEQLKPFDWHAKTTMPDAGKKKQIVLIDGVERIEVSRTDFFNEIRTLRTLFVGLKMLYVPLKVREMEFARKTGGTVQVFQMGGHSDEEVEFLDFVACVFHWFGVSICNFSRLTGLIRGIHRGDFTRADLTDTTKFEAIRKSIDNYLSSVTELGHVRVWRNKVFAHFAITDPRKHDNLTTLDMSVIHPVTFNGKYVVGGLTISRFGPSGSEKAALPEWSLTEVFEALEPRFWPGVKFKQDAAAPETLPSE